MTDKRGWLLDAKARSDQSVALTFIDLSSGERVEQIIRPYVPYCYVPPDFGGDRVQKTELLTGSTVNVAKMAVSDRPKEAKAWEDQIRPEMSCVYDLRLNFGAEHSLDGSRPRLILNLDDETQHAFDKTFGSLHQSDPEKYRLLFRFFALLQQPIPEFQPKIVDLSDETTEEQYDSAFVISRIGNVPIAHVQRRQSVAEWIRSALYTYYRANNILIPTAEELRRGVDRTTVEGALTMSPEPGLYLGMTVMDFESLYPSCIDRFNLSYETVDCQHERCVKNRVPETDHHACLERRGIYSAFAGALKDLRIHWYKPHARDAHASQQQHQRDFLIAKILKLLSVSCYGVTVRIQGLASPILAESITGYGRYVLKRTWQIAQELGLSPRYGDTDSIFLDNASQEGASSLTRRVLEALGLELAVDKYYSLCVLTSAKKAYLGVQRDGVADIKGLTAAKSNSPLFFRAVVSKIAQAMSGVEQPTELDKMKEDIIEIVNESIVQLRSGNVPVEDLEYKVALWKEPKEKFDSRILPQAYQAAKLLQRKGKYPHKREEVAFVKVRPFKVAGRSFTVKPPDEARPDEVNTEDYVRSLLQSLSQITEPMGIDLTRHGTKSLADYM